MRETGFNETRTFGIEIETLWPRSWAGASDTANKERLAALLAEAGLGNTNTSLSYHRSHQVTWPAWKLVPDGSINDTAHHLGGIEVVSPILKGEDGLRQVETVGKVLTRAGFRIQRSCGLHVHHDVNDFSARQLATLCRLVNRFAPVIDGLVPPSRRQGGTTYTGPFTGSEMSDIESATEKYCGGDCRYSYGRRARKRCISHSAQRYRNLNVTTSIQRYGTVEFRQHSGTVEADKMVAWVLLTQGLVEKAKVGRSRKKQVEATGDGLKNLLRASGLQDCRPHKQVVASRWKARVSKVNKYWRERAKHFGVIATGRNAAARSRARSASRERVAAATAPAAAS